VIFKIREFRWEDFERLWRLDQECFPPGIAYSRFELGLYIKRRKSFTLVAEGDRAEPRGSKKKVPEIAGFIVVETTREQGHVITIDVDSRARRFGVGSKLLGQAEERLRAEGCAKVVLETAVDNDAALKFYKRHNYFLVKTLPRYYANGVDAFVLEKRFEGEDQAGA
jgi:[ribosomal protein S18]-alanine N-acetyltransferase